MTPNPAVARAVSERRISLDCVLLETRVLQDTDPDLAGLLDEGFEVVGESWGAELRLESGPATAEVVARLRRYVEAARSLGLEVRELDGRDSAAIVALERATEADFAYTTATAHRATTAAEVRAWAARGRRAFGAFAGGELVGLCVGRGGDNDFTTVARSHRRAGIGKAVVAAWMLAAIESEERAFTAGGAAQNDASLGMIRAIGFTVDERWLSLQRR